MDTSNSAIQETANDVIGNNQPFVLDEVVYLYETSQQYKSITNDIRKKMRIAEREWIDRKCNDPEKKASQLTAAGLLSLC